jgi:hypothetical protein
MCALSLGVIGQALVSGGPTLSSLWAGTRWRKVLAVTGLLLVYGVGFEAIGFIPCTLALLLVLMWFVDPSTGGWRRSLPSFATFGVWAAMTKWLKIQLRRASLPASSGSGAGPMDILAGLGQGFAVALQPINLLYCFIGVFIGTLVGVLPGHRPGVRHVAAAAGDAVGNARGRHHHDGRHLLRLHVRRLDHLDPGQYPGRGGLVVTCIDGHEMAKQGRAGPALGMAALASFAAGTFAVLALMLVAPSLARVAIAFGPPEYFSLMLLGLTILSFLSQGSMAKSLLMAAVGLVLGLIGMDQITAQPRLTFDRLELLDGIGLVPS